MKDLLLRFSIFLLLFSMGCSDYPDVTEGNTRDPEDIMDPNLEGVGCPGAEYPAWETSAYVLPYPVGKKYTTGLTNCGGSFHGEGKPDEFAVDIDMDIGTLITASRSGSVVFIREEGEDYGQPNNLVIVHHDDNTYGQYMHLTFDGAIVEVGDEVKPEDHIGYSGATGYAGYPHLHFVVTKNDYKWKYESIPITFRNTDPNEKGLVGSTEYLAKPY